MLFRAFCVYVRPPSYTGDIVQLEQIQRRFTKRLSGFTSLSYSERLAQLCADSLEVRRLKNNLTVIFKMLHGLIDIEFDSIFTLLRVLDDMNSNW